MKHSHSKKLVLAGLFLAIGIILPFFTAQMKEVGDTLLPMHFPVMICGLVCGPLYGFGVGIILPFLRSVLFSMPPIYPNAVWMALELATYGLVIGLLYSRFPQKKLKYLYLSLVAAMICGRLVWGAAKAILLGLAEKAFTLEAFLIGGLIDAIPGIILQLILIPSIVMLIEKNMKNKQDSVS